MGQGGLKGFRSKKLKDEATCWRNTVVGTHLEVGVGDWESETPLGCAKGDARESVRGRRSEAREAPAWEAVRRIQKHGRRALERGLCGASRVGVPEPMSVWRERTCDALSL